MDKRKNNLVESMNYDLHELVRHYTHLGLSLGEIHFQLTVFKQQLLATSIKEALEHDNST